MWRVTRPREKYGCRWGVQDTNPFSTHATRGDPGIRVFAALGAAAAGWAWHQAAAAHLVFAYDLEALRLAFRVAGMGALEGLAVALVVYCSFKTWLATKAVG